MIPSPEFVPAAVLQIADVETLRVLADPLRIRILELFDTHPGHALTVKAIAAGLGEPVTKLYYHVNMLEEHRLLVVVETRLVSGITEKRYRVAAETLQVDSSLMGTSASGIAPEVLAVLDAVFGASRRSLEIALRTGEARLGQAEPAPGRVVLAHEALLLSPAGAAEARRLIAELLETIRGLASAAGSDPEPTLPMAADPGSSDPGVSGDERRYGLLVAFHPIAAGGAATPAPFPAPGDAP